MIEDFLNERLPGGVELMRLNKENIEWLWKNINKFDSLFSDFAERDFGGFVRRLCDNDTVCFKISDTGYIFLEQISPMKDCKFHGATFDRNLKGKEGFAISVVRLAFELYQLRRMSAGMPQHARYAMGFLKRIGFKREGTIRESYRYKGEWEDFHLYGLLKSEVP